MFFAHFVSCGQFVLWWLICCVYFLLVIGTSAVNCLERFISEVACCVSSGTLNTAHSLTELNYYYYYYYYYYKCSCLKWHYHAQTLQSHVTNTKTVTCWQWRGSGIRILAKGCPEQYCFQLMSKGRQWLSDERRQHCVMFSFVRCRQLHLAVLACRSVFCREQCGFSLVDSHC